MVFHVRCQTQSGRRRPTSRARSLVGEMEPKNASSTCVQTRKSFPHTAPLMVNAGRRYRLVFDNQSAEAGIAAELPKPRVTRMIACLLTTTGTTVSPEAIWAWSNPRDNFGSSSLSESKSHGTGAQYQVVCAHRCSEPPENAGRTDQRTP